jgi:hypothetical protein
MVIDHIDPDDGNREYLLTLVFNSTLTWFVAREHFSTVEVLIFIISLVTLPAVKCHQWVASQWLRNTTIEEDLL